MNAHVSVLLNESIDALAIKAEGIYIDGTFGRGGHSSAILKHLGVDGRLFGMDKDTDAIAYAKKRFGDDNRFEIVHDSFARIKEMAIDKNILGKVNGILLDLGVSSPQLDAPERGFSFTQSGPLDMRMDKTQVLSAAQFVNEASIEDMAHVFKEYGEERFATRIARAIDMARTKAPIKTTLELAEIVKEANPKWEKHKHPATRVFQAIRIYVNQELTDLEACLERSLDVLAPEGRLVVISFHSLEDRIVKQFMRAKEYADQLPKEVPIQYESIQKLFKRVGKVVKPKQSEVDNNFRARSAVLRVGEKIA